MMAQPEPTLPAGSHERTSAASNSRGSHPLLAPLDAAQMLTARGWVVGPADHPDAATHCTCSRGPSCKASSDPTKRGKHPRVRWSELQGPATAEQLRGWFLDGPYGELTNVLVACGPSGLLVVDGDERGALSSYAASIGEAVPDTFRVTTGRGEHHYFALPTDEAGVPLLVGNSPGVLADWHCDVRGGASASGEYGGYVIGPGSMHYSGVRYVAPDPYAAVAPAPAWLLDALTRPATRAERRGLTRGPVRDAGGGGADTRTGTARDPGRTDGGRWTDDIRYGSPAQLVAQFRRHLDEVAALTLTPAEIARGERPNGGEFRHALFRAARDAFRLCDPALSTDGALYDESEALGLVADAVRTVWAGVHHPRTAEPYSGEPDDDDQRIVWDEAAPAAEASPWRVTGAVVRHGAASATSRADLGTAPDNERSSRFRRTSEVMTSGNAEDERTTDGNRTVEPVTESAPPVGGDTGPALIEFPSEDEIEAEQLDVPPAPPGVDIETWETEYRRQHLRRAALYALDAADLPAFTMLDADEWDATPDPDYLVPRLFYRDGLAQVFGAPGVGKSYFVLDIALSIATGRMWRGHRLTGRNGGPGVVHYVMAEGLDVNKPRRDAWLHRHEVKKDELRGHFVVSDGEGLILTQAGIAQYRPHVQRDRPDLIILDTKNALFTGEESSGKDHGEMIRALNTLRKDAGGACVVLIGHSGLVDLTRSRGSNAEEAGTSTATRITRDEDSGMLTAFEKRDKSAGALPAQWHWKLEGVDEVPRPAFMDAPAVCVPVEPDDMIAPVHIEGSWLGDDTPVPDELRVLRGHGRKYALLVYRVLRWVGASSGLTNSDLTSALGKALGDEFDRTQLNRGLALLEEKTIIEHPPASSARWVLAPRHAGPPLGTVIGG